MTDTHMHDAAKSDTKAKAEASFKRKEQQARDGAIAMSEYIADQKAVRSNMEKLRALRLAKEAENAHEAQAADAADATAKPKPKAKAKRKAAH